MTDKVVQNVFFETIETKNSKLCNLFFFVAMYITGVKDDPGGGCDDEDTVISLVSDIDQDNRDTEARCHKSQSPALVLTPS